MTAPVPVSQRLAKIVPLLASDKDGEVLSAARSILRVAAAAGCDVHCLATKVAAAFQDKVEPLEALGWRDLASEIAMHVDALDIAESDFLKNMMALARSGGQPTERQVAWLQAIYRRIHRRSAA